MLIHSVCCRRPPNATLDEFISLVVATCRRLPTNERHSSFVFVVAELLDAICCDPPYGIRAGARKSAAPLSEEEDGAVDGGGSDASSSSSSSSWSLMSKAAAIAATRSTRTPKTQVYNPCDVINDLLDFAAEALRMGGCVRETRADSSNHKMTATASHTIHNHTVTHTYTLTHTRTHTRTRTRTLARAHTHTHRETDRRTHIRTDTHTHAHTRTHTQAPGVSLAHRVRGASRCTPRDGKLCHRLKSSPLPRRRRRRRRWWRRCCIYPQRHGCAGVVCLCVCVRQDCRLSRSLGVLSSRRLMWGGSRWSRCSRRWPRSTCRYTLVFPWYVGRCCRQPPLPPPPPPTTTTAAATTTTTTTSAAKNTSTSTPTISAPRQRRSTNQLPVFLLALLVV